MRVKMRRKFSFVLAQSIFVVIKIIFVLVFYDLLFIGECQFCLYSHLLLFLLPVFLE